MRVAARLTRGLFLFGEIMNKQEAIDAAKGLDWAKFVAMDDSGAWNAFSHHPYKDDESGMFLRPQVGGWGAPIGEKMLLGKQEVNNGPFEVTK